MKLDTLLRRGLLPGLLCSATLAAHAQNVGVGTLTPSEKLDVVGGNLKLSTSGSRLIFPDGTAQGTAASGTGFILNGTAPQATSSYNISGSGAIGGNLSVGMGAAGGRLGVGTNGPAGMLANTPDNVLATDGNGISQQGIGWVNSSSVGYVGVFYNANNTASGPGLAVKVANTGAAAFDVSQGTRAGTAGTSLLRVNGNGNVGIGTTTPSHPLTVQAGAATNSPLLGFYSQAGADQFNFSLQGGGLNLSESGVASGRLFVQPGGNVGIGTTNPSQTLDVSGNANVSGTVAVGGSLALRNSASEKYNWSLTNGGLNLSESNVAAGRIFVQDGGNVGLGTTNPIAPLHVNGSISATPSSGSTSYFAPGSGLRGPEMPNGSGPRSTVAYFTGGQLWVNDYIVAGALNTTSDRRIKHVIGLSDRVADLALLQRVRITDYTYIDQHANTDQVVKKVIAQEVAEVLPAAVSRSTQAIPNVYAAATRISYTNGLLTVTLPKAHELPAGGGRMRFYTPTNESLDPQVQVVDAHTVRFASAQAYAGGLFVYGKYVDDFLSVDYSALTTLNVSATQELARQVAELKATNAALQTQAAQATATLDTFEARLRRLEAATAQARR